MKHGGAESTARSNLKVKMAPAVLGLEVNHLLVRFVLIGQNMFWIKVI